MLTFVSNINSDNGYTSKSKGNHESTMELYLHEGWTIEEGSADVEWDVESLGETETIRLWWENGVLTDYDGVFELPKEVSVILREIGITIPDDFFE